MYPGLLHAPIAGGTRSDCPALRSGNTWPLPVPQRQMAARIPPIRRVSWSGMPCLLPPCPRALAAGRGTIGVSLTCTAAHADHTELPAAASSARSVYQVESTWTTATAQSLRLGDLQGKVQVLAMVYTICESACPIIVSLMQRIEAALPPELRPDVGFM